MSAIEKTDDSEPGAVVSTPHLREPVFKRPFDVLLSGIGLILSLPLWVVAAVLIWLQDGWPIFFRQSRIGRYGKLFQIRKFRSMIKDPDSVEVQATKNDPRITSVGRFLRRTAMDELPQLWSVFVGDMSFVGPRAQPEKERVKVGEVEKEIYIRQIPGYTYRQLVKPGMTGIAQVYAPRDIPHRYKFKYDLIYVRKILSNASLQGRAAWVADFRLFCLDVKLILLAFWMTFRGKWEI